MQILGTILGIAQSVALVYFTLTFNKPLTIFIHEAGHAFAGWSVGLKLKSFDVGANGGQCIFHEDTRAHELTNKPAHIAWIAASGSLANILAAVLLLVLALALYQSAILPGVSVLFGCVLAVALTNTIVASFLFFHRKDAESDGHHLSQAWQMWRAKKDRPVVSKTH